MSINSINKKIEKCRKCPRLTEYLKDISKTKKKMYADEKYWGKPLPGFGDPAARLLIAGLAPAAHGANRTGRMFTGDGTDGMGSSDFLMRSLHKTGFANQQTSQAKDDGLVLTDCYINNIIRCAPPANKPNKDEILNCRPFLLQELSALKNLKVIVALGKIAFDQMLKIMVDEGFTVDGPKPVFRHGAEVKFKAESNKTGLHPQVAGWHPLAESSEQGGGFPILIGTYHPSRQNTQTGRLTQPMLTAIFTRAKGIIK